MNKQGGSKQANTLLFKTLTKQTLIIELLRLGKRAALNNKTTTGQLFLNLNKL